MAMDSYFTGRNPPSARLLRELRERAPITPAGRKPVIGGPPRVRRALARTNALTAKPPAPDAGADSQT